MPSGSTLRFDQVPLEDFLACLMQYEADVRSGFLPANRALKEALLRAGWKPGFFGEEIPVSIYLLQEIDALSQKVEMFLLVHAPSRSAADLRELALRLRRYLKNRQVPSLFRIDPRYGLITGSALEPVDPTVRWDRPGSYIALYLTDDPASPSLAVMEYVPADQRKRFQDLFHRYNAVAPATPSLFKATFKRIMKGGTEVEPPRKLNYKLLKGLSTFLSQEGVSSPTISLIFKDLSAEDGKRVLLDPRFGSFYPNGQDRFVASLGELA